MNLIAFHIAAHPTGRNPWYDVPWTDGLLEALHSEIASARSVTPQAPGYHGPPGGRSTGEPGAINPVS